MASWTPTSEVRTIIQDLEATFKAGKTLPVEWRKEQLKQLWRMIDVSTDQLNFLIH
jgi:hypothetical protein